MFEPYYKSRGTRFCGNYLHDKSEEEDLVHPDECKKLPRKRRFSLRKESSNKKQKVSSALFDSIDPDDGDNRNDFHESLCKIRNFIKKFRASSVSFYEDITKSAEMNFKPITLNLDAKTRWSLILTEFYRTSIVQQVLSQNLFLIY